MNGGLGMGEIGIVVAPTGVGKSHVLVHVGASALSIGKNVFYYTMELNERLIGIRFDSHFSNISSTDCPDNKSILLKIREDSKDTLGRLIIKNYPPRTITTNTIRAHIEKMSYKNIKPDLIIIDYAAIIRSTERYELPRLEMQCVIQEIRKLGQELQVPIWTALQSNKEGAKSDIIDVTNMAESYGQAAEADFVIGLQRQSKQKSTGYGTLFVAKSRLGIDGLQFPIHLNTACSKIRVLTESEQNDLSEEAADIKVDAIASMRKAIADRQAMFRKPGDKHNGTNF
jgi:replicative DNA helicase